MIDHTGLNVSDPQKSLVFYEKALAPLGYRMLFQVPVEHTEGKLVFGFGDGKRPHFWIGEGEPQRPHIHIAFRATSKKQVDDFYAAALENGGRDNGAPGPRPHYRPDYYGAFVLDPDGHNVEAVYLEAEDTSKIL